MHMWYVARLEQAGAQPVASYLAGDSFGELALMYSCARAATVRCVQPGLLWGLDRISSKRIVQQAHAASSKDLEALLRACEPLRDLDMRQIRALTHSKQVQAATPGRVYPGCNPMHHDVHPLPTGRALR
jgi:CRP-like cAMP-binding protein